jgi:prevent-host-death family protein
MTVVNMLEAKTNLSRLVDAVESGAEAEIIIARDGRPAARLVPLRTAACGPRLGVAKGRFAAPEPDRDLDESIAQLFTGAEADLRP